MLTRQKKVTAAGMSWYQEESHTNATWRRCSHLFSPVLTAGFVGFEFKSFQGSSTIYSSKHALFFYFTPNPPIPSRLGHADF